VYSIFIAAVGVQEGGSNAKKKPKTSSALFPRVAFGGTSVEKRRTKYAQRSKRREKRKGTCLKGWMNKPGKNVENRVKSQKKEIHISVAKKSSTTECKSDISNIA